MTKTEGNKDTKTKTLRATISIIIRGGPIRVNVKQPTKPVMLKGMHLPAEARFIFRDPTDYSSKYDNHPISIEFFFGENGREINDTFLGSFPLQEFLPEVAGSRNIELKLTVSANQILSISLFQVIPQKYEHVGFIDISTLEPPEIELNTDVDKSDNFKKAYQDIMEMVKNPQPRQIGISRRGNDIEQDVTISFDEALHGCSKTIEIIGTQTCHECTGDGTASGKTLSSCTDCQGTGWAKEIVGEKYRFTACATCQGNGLVNIHPCPTCYGNGWVRIKRSIELQIPAYFDSGAIVCILYQGEPGRFGGLPGHLQITVNVAPHALFTRSGRDIYIDLPLCQSITKQGGRFRVPGLQRETSFVLDLPIGTRTDMVFQVSENEEYSFFVRVKTYRSAFLFMMPKTRRQIDLIKERLGDVNIEIPSVDESVLDEKILHPQSPPQPMAPSQEKSAQQAEFYTRRGMIYADKGYREHALSDFNMALELNPECTSAYDKRGALYMSQKEPEKALADLNKVVELAPHNAEYLYHRGILRHLQRDASKALNDYAKALELDSTNAEIYESRGKVYTLQKNLEASLADFNKALELDPTRAESYYQRGLIYQYKNNLAMAIVDLDTAVELDPENVSIRDHRAQVYIQLDDLEKALDDANRLVEKQPINPGAYNNRGYIYYLQKEYAKALDEYNKALKLDPNFIHAYGNRGKTYLELALFKQAIEDFNRLLSSHTGEAWCYLWIGRAYQGLGMKKKSLEYCQKALETSSYSELQKEVQNLLSDLDLE